jgi:hypothetical protein
MINPAEGQMWRIFISSTSRDLGAERGALEKALRQMRGSEYNGMEYFGSRPDKPREACLREVRESHVYVGVFADRYGFIDAETGRSMTEGEYREALAAGLPCLIYLRDGAAAPAAGDELAEPEESKTLLRSLKDELRLRHVITTFRNPDDLAAKVVLDLHNLFHRRSEAPAAQTPASLLAALTSSFDLEELRTLCFELDINFDDLRGEGRAAKARELVLFAHRHGKSEALAALIREKRSAPARS